jgi:hypothetical protein
MQAHPVHVAVHHVGRAGHVAHVLQQAQAAKKITKMGTNDSTVPAPPTMPSTMTPDTQSGAHANARVRSPARSSVMSPRALWTLDRPRSR